jgi:ACS family hexuronate transporter-like MFS transporter
VIAPPLTVYLAERYGWREAFIFTGTLGLIWIPVWSLASRTVGSTRAAAGGIETAILRDRRLWGFVFANALSMITYSLWTNWLVLYLTDVMRLTLAQAARFAWIPPLFATLGGLAGGWLSLRWMEHGLHAVAARTRVCLAGAVLALSTALIPLLPNAAWASGGISLSILAVAAFSVNMYTLPLDTFGGARAAFAVSMLVSSYGAVQAVISPIFGAVIDRFGYAPLCVVASVTPLAAYGVLKWTEPE